MICPIYAHFMAKRRMIFPWGGRWVFSYLNKIAFGIKHFAALNRKFDLAYLDRSDLIPLTAAARELLQGRSFEK